MENLAERACVSCQGDLPPLTTEELAPLKAQIDQAWQVDERSSARHGAVRFLTRQYVFGNFAQALNAADEIGALAEEQQHHPDLHVSWGKLGVDIWTHKIGGLTESDVIFAAKCDALLSRYVDGIAKRSQ